MVELFCDSNLHCKSMDQFLYDGYNRDLRYERVKRLLPVNYFCTKAPPKIFNRVMKMPLLVERGVMELSVTLDPWVKFVCPCVRQVMTVCKYSKNIQGFAIF